MATVTAMATEITEAKAAAPDELLLVRNEALQIYRFTYASPSRNGR